MGTKVTANSAVSRVGTGGGKGAMRQPQFHDRSRVLRARASMHRNNTVDLKGKKILVPEKLISTAGQRLHMFASRRAITRIAFSTAAIVGGGLLYSNRDSQALRLKGQANAAMPYSDYHVNHIHVDDLPQSPPATILDSRSFPPSDLEIEDVVTTEISLWEVESNVGGFLSLSYWRSLFNKRKDYNVILHQTDPITDETQAFLLHVSDDLESSQDAYESVCSTLTPLVDDCTLLLTEELLEEIILPTPKKASELATHLVEVIETNLDAYPDWVKVLQSLVLGAVTRESFNSTDNGHRAVDHKKDSFLQKHAPDHPQKVQFLQALNKPNEDGDTPLILSVRNGYVASAVIFLEAGANPDVQHNKTGDTALHLAVETGNSSLLKALLAFGANVEIKNRKGKTPLDIARAKGAKECMEILVDIIKRMAEAASQVSNTFEPLPVPPNAVFLLSLDGGGTRGLLLTQTLIAIQKRMKELKPDCDPLHKYFDYVAGTSAGGLVTLSLVCANATLEATRASLFKAGDEICTQAPTFPARVVAKTSKETYGKDTGMTEVENPRVIITTVLADRNPPALHLMCNYGEARNEQKPPSEWKVWEVSRATSAAPFYFPPFDDKFVDGGVMANNPTLDAMSEIVNQAEREGSDAKLALVVSIGTGVPPPPPKVEDVGIFVPNLTNFFRAIVDLPDTFSAVVNFLHLLISQATVSNGQETIRANAWCKSLGIPYYRLSVPLEKVVDLSESDKKVLTDMMYQGNKYLLDNAKQIDTIARYLLSRSQR